MQFERISSGIQRADCGGRSRNWSRVGEASGVKWQEIGVSFSETTNLEKMTVDKPAKMWSWTAGLLRFRESVNLSTFRSFEIEWIKTQAVWLVVKHEQQHHTKKFIVFRAHYRNI
jgi:hypothetical protein